MAERKAAKKRMHKVAESSTVAGKNRQGFTDEGHMWPTAFALKELTAAAEARIGAGEESGELRYPHERADRAGCYRDGRQSRGSSTDL